MQTTSRLGIEYPDLIDSADAPLDLGQIANLLDPIVVIFGQGPIASRPISTPGQPGKQGRLYLSTDENPNTVYWDFGTGWISVGAILPGSIGTLQLADRSVTEIKIALQAVGTPELTDGAVATAKLADLAVTAAKIAAALKPSQGAGATTEALRALGTAAGMAAAGTHAAQHAPGGADPISFITNSGSVFPTFGLTNGQRFTLLISDQDYTIPWDFVYRPDIDATHPWLRVSGEPLYFHDPGGSIGWGGTRTFIEHLLPFTGIWRWDIEAAQMLGGQTFAPNASLHLSVGGVEVQSASTTGRAGGDSGGNLNYRTLEPANTDWTIWGQTSGSGGSPGDPVDINNISVKLSALRLAG